MCSQNIQEINFFLNKGPPFRLQKMVFFSQFLKNIFKFSNFKFSNLSSQIDKRFINSDQISLFRAYAR